MDFPYQIPLPVALAVIAVLGYLVGRRSRTQAINEADKARRELRRAKVVAKELEQIAEGVRKHLATHHLSVARFKDRVSELSGQEKEAAWQELCREAEQILKPTLRLAEQIAQAYDEIRQQTNHLMTFTEVRTDPLTRVSNRRGLDETLESMFALMERYEQPFSLAIFDIDHFKQVNDKKGHLHGDRTLQAVARMLDETVRDTDIVARYGGEEFVVVMPHTTLENACLFAERVRTLVETDLGLTISGGVAMALDGDNAQSLLSRADAALYSGKAAGRNRIFRHTGADIEPVDGRPRAELGRRSSARLASDVAIRGASDLSAVANAPSAAPAGAGNPAARCVGRAVARSCRGTSRAIALTNRSPSFTIADWTCCAGSAQAWLPGKTTDSTSLRRRVRTCHCSKSKPIVTSSSPGPPTKTPPRRSSTKPIRATASFD